MRPTRIYVRALQALRARFPVHGLAHVTGGGLPGNVPRMLSEGLGVRIHRGTWPVPPIFALLAEAGGLAQSDVDLAFNQGLGMVIATPPEAAAELAEAAGGWVVGEVVSDPAGRAELV
jgi:phosphoribosylformylglycinamidine cyclo-ligase